VAPGAPFRRLLEAGAAKRFGHLRPEAVLSRLGHRPRIVSNGLEALQALQAPDGLRYDIVLMDMQMPELDGLEATRRIRALPGEMARIPVVAMTANVRDDDRRACQQAGMDAFIGKPIDFDELDATLRRLVPGSAAAPPRAWPAPAPPAPRSAPGAPR
jgi:CheY-like chemotaxis protein